MVYKYFNLTLFLRAFLLILLTISATLLFIHEQWVFFGVSILLITGVVSGIIYYFNSVNRKLAFFFDSIRNEDSTLRFPDIPHSDALRHLHQSLNHVNKLISEIKIRNEHKERFFLEFMKHSASGLLAVDEQGYIELVNDAALKLFNIPVLVHINRLKQINQDFYDAIINLSPNNAKTIKVLVKEELHIVLINRAKLKFGEKSYDIYSLNDIKTELDEKEMETWQKLIRILTHEIMNSIAPISSISDTLLNYFKHDNTLSEKELKNTRHGLEVINERSHGLGHFVENYRKLTKIPKPVFNAISVQDWMDSIGLLFSERVVKEAIDFKVVNEYKGETFLGDQKLLTQVVINLLNNAADAMKNVNMKKLGIHISGSDQEYISIKFVDNGKGIAPEFMDQIFMPFFTTKENGSGIGLSLSLQIIKLHKGRLTVRSVPEIETVFEIRI